MNATLPTIIYEAPEGHEWTWAPAGDDWKLTAPEESRPCRWGAGYHKPACGRPSVAALRRGFTRPSWWHYCEEHLYGRIIVDGQILGMRLVATKHPGFGE